jgi:hypothetical protein
MRWNCVNDDLHHVLLCSENCDSVHFVSFCLKSSTIVAATPALEA